MKNFIFIKLFFVLIYSISSVGFSETWNDLILKNGQYYKKTSDLPFTGEISEKVKVRVGGSFQNGYREGPWVRYWDNGHLQSKGNYKKGKQDGLWVTYFNNGNLWVTETFNSGKRHGLYIEYHRNEQLSYKGEYKNDKLEGLVVSFYKNGKERDKETSEMGKKW